MVRPVSAPNSKTIPSTSMPSTYVPGTGVQRSVVMSPSVTVGPRLEQNQKDWETQQGAADDWYTQWQEGNLRDRQGAYTDWETNTNDLINQQAGIFAQGNTDRVNNTAGYRSALEGIIGQNNAALGTYNQRANDLYNTTVPDYVAQQWTSNPQDIANQNQALGQFSDIYGGGLDYQAALATLTQAGYTNAEQTLAQLYQYASDPSDVKRQKDALNQLHGLISGGEWNEGLRDARDKYKALTDPEVTAQERFIMEQFNQRRQDLDRANREAVMSNLAARGLRSGAAEQTAMLNSQQELGRESVLAALGAQKNAIDRSQQALQGYASTSAAGRQSELAAMGMYIDASGQLRQQNDNVGMFNTQQANQNSMFNAGEANDISMFNANAYNQNQMFNAGQANQVSMYNAGQQNNAYANNQATRLAGAQGYADQSNAIRQSNDYVGTFNTGQQNLVGMQNQRVAQDELVRKGNVNSQQVLDNANINGQNADYWGTIHDTQQADIDSRVAGETAITGAKLGREDSKLTNKGTLSDKTAAVGSDLYGGVFTPTITTRKNNKDINAAGSNYIYG
jgi:hypothetical protein